MDQNQTAEPIAATANEAFEALQAEVSLLRRGIEALTVERQAAPDYAPSFARVEKQYAAIKDWAKRLGDAGILVVTSVRPVKVPVVRFQSACVFGEGLRAVDCDCGAQLEAAVGLICSRGGVVTYAWEEGRGLGIAAKLDAIALEQSLGINTVEAFSRLGRPAEPRTFDNHVAALRMVFGGDAVVLASRNPTKIDALRRAGIAVVDRIDLQVPVTPERERYLASKIAALGHIV